MESNLHGPKAANDDKEIRLRRYRDALAITGGAVIAFSVWDVVKFLIGLFLGEERLTEIVRAVVEDMEPQDAEEKRLIMIFAMVVTMTLILLICAAIILYHLYIGLSAYRAGHQTAKREKKMYLVWTAVNVLFSVVYFVPNAKGYLVTERDSWSVGLATLLVELTSLLNYLNLLYVAYRIRGLRKEGAV